MRTEKDFIGEIQLPKDAIFGIHSVRARNNFPDNTPFHREWYKAMACTKRACYITAKDFIAKAADKISELKIYKSYPDIKLLSLLEECALECEQGLYYEDFIVPAISGGAGTSINMNLNEIITNLALIKSGFKAGDYDKIHPIETANIFQSTNDVVPTALRVATMQLLENLEESINSLRFSWEEKEKKYRNDLRIAYTQMQEAVPTTFGRLFSTYCDAFSRDWWRISKCNERIKVVNLGGSAIGTSIAVPKYYVTEVVKTLQKITGLPVTRGENLSDATSNLDPFVEVHGILKAHAVNLEKMVNDIRLLASDIHGSGELKIPKKQVGSSIMPGKINPVIPEFVISSVYKVYSNDLLITALSGQGCLELNAYLPAIGHTLLESLKLLIACNNSLKDNLVDGIEIETEKAYLQLLKSPSVSTILIPFVGYNKAAEMAGFMKAHGVTIIEANNQLCYVTKEKLTELLKPYNMIQGGYQLKDLLENN